MVGIGDGGIRNAEFGIRNWRTGDGGIQNSELEDRGCEGTKGFLHVSAD